MPVNSYPNGVVASSTGGHAHFSSSKVLTDRLILYVDANHANASDTNPGTQIEAPFATLAGTGNDGLTNGAYFTAAANDIIIVAASHSETVGITVAKAGVSIIGLGSGTTRPTLTARAGGFNAVFKVTAAAVEIRNFRFRDPVSVPP